MSNRRQVPLDQLRAGNRGTVRALNGGATFASRLAGLGLSLGSELGVLQNRGHGPVLVLVRDTRIALGRGEAMKILVETGEGE